MNRGIFESVYDTILQRDTRYDGIYYTGIKTTGIVCRPSCKSRTPKRENVQIYQSVEDAMQAGFRPCKRCKPEQVGTMGPDAQIADAVKRIIQHKYTESLTLETLSRKLLISSYHLQRVFKGVIGKSPAEFLIQTRLKQAKELLKDSSDPISVIAEKVGFRSKSHFSMTFKKKIGITPTEYRDSMKEATANDNQQI